MMLNFNIICRLCLKNLENEEKVELFMEEEGGENILQLHDKVITVAVIEKMFYGDGLPAQVCQQCVDKVTTSYEFKLLCEESDRKLRTLLADSSTVTTRIRAAKQENPLQEWTCPVLRTQQFSSEFSTSEKPVHHNKEVTSHPSKPEEDVLEHGPAVSENELNYVSDEDNTSSSMDNPERSKHSDSSLKPFVPVDIKDRVMKLRTSVTSKLCEKNNFKRLNTNAKYRCSFCKKPFINKAHLSQHVMTHTGEKPFVCHVCGVAFARYSNLRRHTLRHSREDSGDLIRGRHKTEITAFECAVCLKIFKKKPYLVEHLMSHTGEKPYKCEVCGIGFRRHSNLARHVKSHCENDYLTGQIIRRGRRKHIGHKILFDCDVCSKTFKIASHLKTHMLSHTGEKPFMCDVCGQFFARRTNMIRHVRLHTEGSYKPGEIPRRGRRKKGVSFDCHVCFKPFQHMSRWREHLMSHTGEKPHMCDVCGKFFARRTNLVRHSKVHFSVTQST